MSEGRIVLQFVASDDPESEAIRWFSRGWCSHVDAVLPDGSLLGARLDGVKIRPPDYAAFSQRETVCLTATPEQEEAFYAFLHAQVGKGYDRLAIVAFAVRRDWRDDSKWFCSELIARALEVCGWLPKPLAHPANQITPRDLLLVTSSWSA
jgi:hypothetical protein